MDVCSVPDCKLKSQIKFHSTRNLHQLNLWRKILNISDKNIIICDQHFEERFIRTKTIGVTADAYPTLYLNNVKAGSNDICQCCMRSFVNQHFNQVENFYMISDDFQIIFRDVMGCSLPIGLICKKCFNFISEFNTFREKIRKRQSTRKNILENSLKYQDTNLTQEVSFTADEDNEETDSQFEVLDDENENFHIEIKDSEEFVVESEIEIKEEQFEYDTPKRQKPYPENDSENKKAKNSSSPADYDGKVIKLESVDGKSKLKIRQKREPSMKISKVACYVPKITISQRGRPIKPKNTSVNPNPPQHKRKTRGLALPTKRSQHLHYKSASIESAPKINCQYCPERFASRSAILDHVHDMHSFRCPSCPDLFPFKVSLLQHQAKEHQQTLNNHIGESLASFTYSCPVCNITFSSCDSLEQHMKQKHITSVNIVNSSSEDEQSEQPSNENSKAIKFTTLKPSTS